MRTTGTTKAFFCTTLLTAAFVAQSKAITVSDLGVVPYEIVTVNCTGIGTVSVYAGVVNLVVDGTAMNGFCIDPFHFSLPSSTGYSYVSLNNAPKGNPMGALNAMYIQRLWGSYYSPTMNAATAAGLQIAIWELVGGANFSLVSGSDYGASGMLSAVESATYSGSSADLIGLTGPGQDYAIESGGRSVPDGGPTLALLGGALSILGLLRKRIFVA